MASNDLRGQKQLLSSNFLVCFCGKGFNLSWAFTFILTLNKKTCNKYNCMISVFRITKEKKVFLLMKKHVMIHFLFLLLSVSNQKIVSWGCFTKPLFSSNQPSMALSNTNDLHIFIFSRCCGHITIRE